MGKPNVGKSTLINAFLGQKIAAVSPRPQTTRKRQMGILTQENAQVIFLDTPGVHQPRHKLGEAMNQEAASSLEEADLALWIVDASQPPDEEDGLIAALLSRLGGSKPALVVMNKIDLLSEEQLTSRQELYAGLAPQAKFLPVSCLRGDGLPEALAAILQELPEGPPFFSADQVTDLYERELAADLIREACLHILRDEVPHGIAVRIDQFTERGEHGAYIEATLIVEKETHKGIVIGAGGTMVKQIGAAARQEIEMMSGRKVYLQLQVKVRKNWRDDEKTLKAFGF